MLGVCSDLSPTPTAPPLIRLESDRLENLLLTLHGILAKQSLSPRLAGKLWGRLNFAASQAYGKFGRAQLRALSRRHHEVHRYWLNPQLLEHIQWWITTLPHLPPRPIPTSTDQRRTVISYSDGEGKFGQVGIAVWQQGQKIGRAGVIRVPE